MTELEKAARLALEALELALSSHGVMLLSDPPQDPWKTRGVEGKSREAITALRQALEQQHCRKEGRNNGEYVCDCKPGKCLEQQSANEPVAFPAPKFEAVADGVEVGYDLFGGVDIRLGGEFVYVHINYDYRYTDNASRRWLAEQIVGLLTHPQPAAQWVGLTDEEREAHRDLWKSNIHDEEFEEIEAKLREKNGGKA